jgi:hypothetical protein
VSSSCTHSCGDWDVLGEDNTLDLDDEEVNQALEVVKRAFERLLWDLIVSAGSDGAGDAGAHYGLASSFSKCDDCTVISYVQFVMIVYTDHRDSSRSA